MPSSFKKPYTLNSIHNRQYFLGVIIFLLFCQPVSSFTGRYPIQNFTPSEYKAGIQNIDFAQNRDMTLFVANNLSVLSFNGDEWDQKNLQTGKKKRSLSFDESTNRLYVGLQGEFGYFQEDWNYISLSNMIPEHAKDFDEVWDVFIMNGRVYFCTFQGIYVYDGEQVKVINQDATIGRSFNVNGRLFTQSEHGKLFELKGSVLVPTNLPVLFKQVIAGIVPYEEGYLLFHNSGEIAFSTSFGVSRTFDDLANVLKGTYVNHVLQLSDTRLVISTQTAGLFLYNIQNNSIEKINVQNGLATNACLRSFQDYYGNLWVGMQNGIALIHINSPMRLLSKEINIQGSGYEAYETDEGTYFTTSNGIYFLAKGANKSIFLAEASGPAYGIEEIAGKLYAGHHTGLFLLENGNAKRIASTGGLWKVQQLQSHPDYAIGGTYTGLFLFKLDNNKILRPIKAIDDFNSSSRFFEEDEQGRIWVGQYYKGLYCITLSENLESATVKKFSKESDFSIDDQIILSRVNNKLHLATNNGLSILDPMTNEIKKTDIFGNHIGAQPIYLFEQDQKNNVYILAENTVGFFKQISNENYQFIPSSLYQLRFHLNNDLLHISTNTNSGVLFSANEGFIHYDPKLEYLIKSKQPLAIKKVFSVTEDKTFYARASFEVRPESIPIIDVHPSSKVIKFDVESFQFNDLNTTKFRYFLKGFDQDFGEWTDATTKEYTNLREGEYEFTAQTQNYLGRITSSQTILLKVHPPIHRSFLAKCIYVLFGIISLAFVSRFQKLRYKQKAKEIEEVKYQELNEKEQELAEVEAQKEKELLELKEEKTQSELQHVNKLLAASTMNLVVKNEFIDSIKEELKKLQQSDRKAETKKALEKIVKEIDITLKLQDDWEQFEYHFDKVHGDFLIRLRNDYPNLSPSEQKLCALLRMNLNTKDIANMLSISLRGVEVARYRLRKKLTLEKGRNLSKFILEY